MLQELKETKAKLRAAEEQLATYQQQYGKQTAGLAVDLETSNKTLNTTRNVSGHVKFGKCSAEIYFITFTLNKTFTTIPGFLCEGGN